MRICCGGVWGEINLNKYQHRNPNIFLSMTYACRAGARLKIKIKAR